MIGWDALREVRKKPRPFWKKRLAGEIKNELCIVGNRKMNAQNNRRKREGLIIRYSCFTLIAGKGENKSTIPCLIYK